MGISVKRLYENHILCVEDLGEHKKSMSFKKLKIANKIKIYLCM